jgi:hypothetical protein
MNTLVFFVFFDQMCTTLLVSSINAYKCHIINFFINLACSVCTEKYRISVFCTNLALYGLGLYKKKTSVDISQYRPRIKKLILALMRVVKFKRYKI